MENTCYECKEALKIHFDNNYYVVVSCINDDCIRFGRVYFTSKKCNHERLKVIKRERVNGGSTFRKLCFDCLQWQGNLIKKKDVTSYTEYFTLDRLEDLKKFNREKIEEALQFVNKINSEIIKKQNEEFEDKVEWYRNVYLNSSAWKQLREKALKRDGHVCQGCLENIATEVHHLTYDNVGDELLFQLISVCRDCHLKIHKS